MGGSAYAYSSNSSKDESKEYKEYDNFWQSSFIDENGIYFPSVEHYYQYNKCVKESDRKSILEASIEDVYSLGQNVELREDWEEVKLDVMYKGNYMKFTQNEILKNMLKNTKGFIYVPSVLFGCLFWGSGINLEGKNWNGKILMAVRDSLNNESIEDFLFEKKYECFMAKMKN
jgi:ribA/ribD-fused uncharacterized protein